MAFHDHFSTRAAAYARFRPTYPPALFAWLAAEAPERNLAWDAGTGSGQAAVGLAAHFARVLGTDPSAPQLAQAPAHAGITWRQGVESDSGLAADSADLVTAAQALHWFDVPAFFREALRVLRPDGILAVWCYNLHRVDPDTDSIFDRFYRETVGPWWPPERVHVERGYRDLPFPLPELTVPEFAMEATLDLDRLLAYVGTWSAVSRYTGETGIDPLPALKQQLEPVWGEPARERRVRWPLSIRVGRWNPA